MKTLAEYIKLQAITGVSDIEIIRQFFIDNDIEEKGIELSYELTKTKIEKMKHRHHIIKEWTYNIPSEYLYNKYPLDVAVYLHRIELDYIVNGEVTDYRLEWAKENLPNIKEPEVYFQPCINWLTEHGIKFQK